MSVGRFLKKTTFILVQRLKIVLVKGVSAFSVTAMMDIPGGEQMNS